MRYTRGVNPGCFKDSGFMLTPCCNMRLSLHWVSLVCSDNVTSCESCHVSVMCEKSRLKFENEERSFESVMSEEVRWFQEQLDNDYSPVECTLQYILLRLLYIVNMSK